MKKITLLITILMLSGQAVAINDFGSVCGDIDWLRSWSAGNDRYGIRVSLESNPAECPNGFFLPHTGANKQYVFSMLLAAQSSNKPVCIQIRDLVDSIDGACKLNTVKID